MKILALPKGELDGNAGQFSIYREIEKRGHLVDDYRNVNPFSQKYDVIHVHWPENFTIGKTFLHVIKKSVSFLLVLTILKIKGTKIIWTCHDVISLYSPNYYFEKLFMNIFLRFIDGIILPLHSTMDYALTYYPYLKKINSSVIPTGHFIDIYPNKTTKEQARQSLSLANDLFIFGFIGKLEKYKGISELLEAYSGIPGSNTRLLLSGSLKDKQLLQLVRSYAAKDERIIFIEGNIPNDEMQIYFNACDLVVLPFRKINNSGSLLMALSFNKPILAPSFEQIKEMKLKYGGNYLLLYDGIIDDKKLMKAKEEILNSVVIRKHELALMNYDIIARDTIKFFNEIIKPAEKINTAVQG